MARKNRAVRRNRPHGFVCDRVVKIKAACSAVLIDIKAGFIIPRGEDHVCPSLRPSIGNFSPVIPPSCRDLLQDTLLARSQISSNTRRDNSESTFLCLKCLFYCMTWEVNRNPRND
jgi:hypothetical protein